MTPREKARVLSFLTVAEASTKASLVELAKLRDRLNSQVEGIADIKEYVLEIEVKP